ncbi:UDP-N-acetylglucosamine transferase subunit ALG13 [Phycicoccus badiiscoriae]|uniref:UDP-N-acetylglucosamine transferase subunit ALG13 n=1 Tax=Pedococcus badiiscoriae TaxID=642776 RepID=A0A852WEC4_9MICO|nr:glycosyltransferase [Pedococcus badiiscoriae]NYG07378.1 UDP-N-acetylglucosamine transferase subunit ALG13 [Pedococcus badiiscoriae]
MRGAGGATLLIASTGGHLEQLVRLHRRLQPAPKSVEWVTFDDPQSRSLLAGEVVHYVPYVAPRSYSSVVRNIPAAERILRHGRFARIVTTGSAITLSFLPIARARGVECHFIESAARADGPSLTASLVAALPGMRMYSQYPAWADEKWQYRGSVFDSYRPLDIEPPPGGLARRVVVTFGTMRTYGFRRAAEALAKTLPSVLAPGATVLWQVGVTDVSGLGLEAKTSIPASELKAAIAESDLVVAHAGVGSALTSLDLGKAPVLLVRRRAHNEMVDDHQTMIAGELDRRGLGVSAEPGELTSEHLSRALAISVEREPVGKPFLLRS